MNARREKISKYTMSFINYTQSKCLKFMIDIFSTSSINYFEISFADLHLTDLGLYTCTAYSESGETSWSASLTVSNTILSFSFWSRKLYRCTTMTKTSQPGINKIDQIYIFYNFVENKCSFVTKKLHSFD